ALRRAKAIRSAGEVPSCQILRTDVPDLFEPGFAGQRDDLRRSEKGDEGRPAGPRSLLRALQAGTNHRVRKLDRRQESHGQRGSRSKRGDAAQRGIDRVLGQIHAHARGSHDCRLTGIEPRGAQLLPPGITRFKVDGYEAQPVRHSKAKFDQPPSLPRLRTWTIDLEDFELRAAVRPALCERVE